MFKQQAQKYSYKISGGEERSFLGASCNIWCYSNTWFMVILKYHKNYHLTKVKLKFQLRCDMVLDMLCELFLIICKLDYVHLIFLLLENHQTF